MTEESEESDEVAQLRARYRELAELRLRAADEMDRIRGELLRLGAW